MGDTLQGCCLAQTIPSKVSDTQHDAARFGSFPDSFCLAFAYIFFLALFLFLLLGKGIGFPVPFMLELYYLLYIYARAHSQAISLKLRKVFGLLKKFGIVNLWGLSKLDRMHFGMNLCQPGAECMVVTTTLTSYM